MQPSRVLAKWLNEIASNDRYLFSFQDLKGLYPDLSNLAFKTFLSRTIKLGILERVCRGLYVYQRQRFSNGLLLFHAAAYLRSAEFNYISLETVLSDAGVISQIPMNSITVMSSCRSNIVNCGNIGTIEFIHTNRNPADMLDQLSYDPACRLWRAKVGLAISDMKRTRRNTELIDWEVANELI